MSLNVATAYLDVIYNKELLAVTTSLRDASQVQRDRMKRMEETGSCGKR
jgi:outer membrane protein TolC